MTTKPHKNKNRAPLRPLNLPTLALSSCGLGFLRPMPGTWGSLPPAVAAGLIALLTFLGVLASNIATEVYYTTIAILLAASSIACVAFGRYAETRFALPSGEPQKDAPEVVADETAGQALPLLAIAPGLLLDAHPSPDGAPELDWYPFIKLLVVIALAFIAFRGFDIIKPWPGRKLERLPHGWGVLLDDLMAGVYAAVVIILAQVGLAALP